MDQDRPVRRQSEFGLVENEKNQTHDAMDGTIHMDAWIESRSRYYIECGGRQPLIHVQVRLFNIPSIGVRLFRLPYP
jgi:hypothetical protein